MFRDIIGIKEVCLDTDFYLNCLSSKSCILYSTSSLSLHALMIQKDILIFSGFVRE